MNCPDCGVAVSYRKSKTGKCRSCAAKTKAPIVPRPKTAKCLDCGTPVSGKSKTGCCVRCATIRYNKSPEGIAAHTEGWRKRLQRPGEYERLCKVAARNSRKAMADPEKRAKAIERAKQIYVTYLSTDECRAKVRASRAHAGAKIREFRLGWCPERYRALHRENVFSKKMKSADSRKIIEQMIADDEALASGHLESALSWLRRIAPVRMLENGYVVGNSPILRPSEIIKRAQLRGWQPESWAA